VTLVVQLIRIVR